MAEPDKELVGKATRQKTNGLQKFLGVFFAENIDNIGDYIFEEVVKPGIKNMLFDGVKKAWELLIYGENAPVQTTTASKYKSAWEQQNAVRNVTTSVGRKGYSYDTIVVQNRAEGERVLVKLGQILSEVGSVTVADMYDLVGEVHNYTDNKWGWTSLTGARVQLAREGYVVKMPDPIPLS